MSETNSKAQVEFYVAKGEENLGPWTIDQIAEKLGRSEIAVTDFVYDDNRADWIPLLECEALKERLRQAKPKAAPPKKTESASASVTTATAAPVTAKPELKLATQPTPAPVQPEGVQSLAQAVEQTVQMSNVNLTSVSAAHMAAPGEEWYVQKGTNRYGPFSYYGLVRALQEKSVYDFDFVWKEGMPEWVRIAEHEAFQPQKIRELAGKVNKDADVFFRRQFTRVPFESEVIVHDDRSVWMGHAFEASAGGSGVIIENSTLVPGQVVRLHFAPHDGLPAFNALGEIVGKRFSKEVRGVKSPVRYAVRFLKVDGSAEPTVREYFERAG